MSNKTKPSDIAGTRKIIQAAYKVLEASAIKSTGYELDVLIADNDYIDELVIAELERAVSFIKSGEHNKPPEHCPEPPWEREQQILSGASHLMEQEPVDEPQFAVWCDGTSCHIDDLDDYQWMSDDYSLEHDDPNEDIVPEHQNIHEQGDPPEIPERYPCDMSDTEHALFGAELYNLLRANLGMCEPFEPKQEPEPLFPPELAAQADQEVIDRNGWELPETDDCLHCGAILVNEHPEQLCGNCYHDEHPTEPNYEQLGEMQEERERFLYETTGSSIEPKNCEQLERNICDHSFTYYDNSTNESYCSECGNWFRGDRLL